MGDLRDYSAFADPPLRLPVNGKIYELPEISIADGLRISGVITGENTEFEGRPGEDLWKLVCGPVWQQMIDDGCGYKAAARVGFTALVDFERGRELAIIAWEGEPDDPEAPAGEQPANPGPETPLTTLPDEADTTPAPASGPGTSPGPETSPLPPE